MSAGDLWDLPKGNGMVASHTVFLLGLLLHLEKEEKNKYVKTRSITTHEDRVQKRHSYME